MSLMEHVVRDTFLAFNLSGALLIAVLMMFTTPRASISRFLQDPQSKWDMLKRVLFCCIIMGLAGKAFWTLDGWIKPTMADMVFWALVVIPITIFLLLRFLRVIDQDHWLGFGNMRLDLSTDERSMALRNLNEAADLLRSIAAKIENPERRRQALRAASDVSHVAASTQAGYQRA